MGSPKPRAAVFASRRLPSAPGSGAVPERHVVRVEAEVLAAPERRRKGAVTGAVVARIGDSRAVALGREGVGAGPSSANGHVVAEAVERGIACRRRVYEEVTPEPDG